MIETFCRTINLTPIYIEPGRCVREFNTESVTLEYKISNQIMLMHYDDREQELSKIRNKIWEDLANISYKGKVYCENWYIMETPRDRCSLFVLDLRKINEGNKV